MGVEEFDGVSDLLKLSRALADEGYEDVLFVDLEDAGRILTEKRLELIRAVAEGDVESIRGLARQLDRKENVVHEDLTLLFEEGVIDFEEEKNRKIPVLRHENIWIKPVSLKRKATV
ncbi:MAG: hypothetical protein MAG715_01290 [Methanonatronarchaeales archaeon]|nr:hypothetical protein [Methanonatronarchaeales archaeon]